MTTNTLGNKARRLIKSKTPLGFGAIINMIKSYEYLSLQPDQTDEQCENEYVAALAEPLKIHCSKRELAENLTAAIMLIDYIVTAEGLKDDNNIWKDYCSFASKTVKNFIIPVHQYCVSKEA